MEYDGTLRFDTALDDSGLQSGVDRINALANGALKATAGIAAAATAAVTGLGIAAVSVGSDFQASMSNVAAISGATGEELDALKAKAQEMGETTKFSASESADAFSYMAMAGWKTGDMLDGIEGIMNLAAASGEDLALTSDIVTDALTAFGLSASDSGHFADVLAAASSNANTNVALMGETFKYVAPVAGALGFSAEDTATYIGLMANAGIKGSEAGTSLRSTFTRLASPTKDVQEAIDALGVSLTDSEGNVKSLDTVMGEMRTSFSTLSEAEQAQYAAAIAGQEGMSGLLAIVNASQADYDKLSSAIAGATDATTGYSAAAEMAATMNDNLQGQVTILKSGLEGLGIQIFNELDGPLRQTVQTAQEVVSDLSEAFEEGGFEGLASGIGNAISTAVDLIAAALPDLLAVILAVAVSIVDSLPGIIGTIVDFLMDSFPVLLDAGVQLFYALIEAIPTITTLLRERLPEIVGAVTAAIVDGLPDILVVILSVVDSIVDAIPGFISTIVDFLLANIPAMTFAGVRLFSALAEAIPEITELLIERFPEIVEGISVAIAAALPDLLAAVGRTAMLLAQQIPSLLMAVFDALGRFLQALSVPIGEFGGEVMAWISENVPEMVDAVIDYVSALPGRLWDWLTEALENVNDWGAQTRESASEAARLAVDAVIAYFSEMPERAARWLSEVIGRVVSFGRDLVRSGRDAATDFFNGFVDILAGIPGEMWNIGRNIVVGIWNGIASMADEFWEDVAGFFGGIVDGVKSFLGIASPSRLFAEQVGAWIPPGVSLGIGRAMPGLLGYTKEQMARLAEQMQATVNAETSSFGIFKGEPESYQLDQASRMADRSVSVTGQLQGDEPIQVQANLYLDGEKVAEQITPAVNRQMYKIQSRETGRGEAPA